MRVGTFNVENLFSRVAAFNLPDRSDGKPILEAFARVSDLLQHETYTQSTKSQIVAGLIELELDKSDRGRGLVMLRQNRNRLVRRRHNQPMEIIADGRADWIGWLERKEKPVNDIAIENTARVFGKVGTIRFHRRRPPRHLRQPHENPETRLPASIPRPVRIGDQRRSLPQGRLGQQERRPLADIRLDEAADPQASDHAAVWADVDL